MRFLWPALLWGLLLVPALAVGYAAWVRRSAPRALAHPHAAAIAVLVRGSWRRHAAAVLYLVAVASVLLAAARPTFPLPVAADGRAIMLSIDVSGSMRSQDVEPNRLEAAKSAAKAFVAALPNSVRVGLVAFGGYAQLIRPPTTDRLALNQAIDDLGFVRRTAIGEGLMEAVAALPGPVRPSVDGVLPDRPAGRLAPGIVVLLSDGRNNAGMDPLQAAEWARQQAVTVYTVGVGQPVTPNNVWTLGGSLDETTLQEIARRTGGAYHHASTASRLHQVYRTLARQVGWERRPVEVSGIVALVAAAALLAAIAASTFTHPAQASGWQTGDRPAERAAESR
ncbi:MAG: VWA domain-containing protein [Armatimonadota bacterium]|nr:VWA domain-containing protein [Armatimonadota bacterium]MDR5696797.1 VWA domain-containing protein [Armatimonadota bacterium]